MTPLRLLRRHRASLAASSTCVWLAVSCVLSPVEDLPSANDGLDVDGIDGPFDLGGGTGGSSSASGGAPGCNGVAFEAVFTECRGDTLWHNWTDPDCTNQAAIAEECEHGCVAQGGSLSACAFGGAGGMGGAGATP